jgi:hypothetical protein
MPITQQPPMPCVNLKTASLRSSSFMKSPPGTVANASSTKSWHADPGPSDLNVRVARTSSNRCRNRYRSIKSNRSQSETLHLFSLRNNSSSTLSPVDRSVCVGVLGETWLKSLGRLCWRPNDFNSVSSTGKPYSSSSPDCLHSPFRCRSQNPNRHWCCMPSHTLCSKPTALHWFLKAYSS